ncbi:hypothetical protein GHT09_004283 [Marmota monax]|uniref:Uncharacterized protein n=1 Tax=Marmota monax TaxID=9995 RepID=A0A834QVD6_MARMO|nr:hypothetical protein GHT09_004283 [Marmota monax]
MDILDKGMIHVLGGKAYDFITLFRLMFNLKTLESKIMGKRGNTIKSLSCGFMSAQLRPTFFANQRNNDRRSRKRYMHLRALISRIYKELKKLNTKQITNTISQ